MNGISIEKATLSELDELMAWRMEVLHEVFGIPADADTLALEQANREYYRYTLSCSEHIACFARYNGQRVGCGGICLQQEMPSPDNPTGRCAYLMNIYIRPPYRRLHIGTALVGWLVEQAKRQNAGKIYLETSDAGRAMYRRLRFEEMKDIMKLQ
ncbi:GNAT family N-acetyltransferase [uncultured Parabacteroides sp.]|uniref:GNAT family N-acetyltransferase n=1 Tax=uncultured Parabacteroides sp. TaxID=512312 RepID=UPI0025F37431|nr:GNAT family N-acetyltransferase [uncultured Parabacteroides sp.]